MVKLAEEREIYATENTDDEYEIEFRNPIVQLGFAKIDHIIGLDTDLSDGAYRTLAILHYHWLNKGHAFPSIKLLAKLRGKSERTIGEHLAELKGKGIISRQARLGDSSITYLEDLPKEYEDAARQVLSERRKKKGMRKTARGVAKNCKTPSEKLPTKKNNKEEQLKRMPSPNSEREMTMDEEFDSIPSASEGEPKATIDSLKAKEPVDKQLAAMIISIIRQNALSVADYRTVATAVRKRAEYAASLVVNDLRSGKYKWDDVESAYKYLMNGGGEKYRLYTCAPNTVAADIGEWIAKKKTVAPQRAPVPTANMSPFPV